MHMKPITKNPITYKILIDIIILSLIFACGFVVLEAILPGIISEYISPFKLFSGLYVLFITAIWLAHKQKISFPIKKGSKLLFAIALIIFCICIGVASLRLGPLLAILSTLLCASVFAMFYGVLREEIS